MMRKLTAILAFLMILCGVCGCAQQESTPSAAPAVTPAPVTTAAPAQTGEGTDEPAQPAEGETGVTVLTEPIGVLPAFITSAGQSADIEMIKVMFMNNNMTYADKAIATMDDLAGYSTLVVAIGGSSKGLGAAGIDADQELERVKALLTEAKDAGMTIIAMHIGGTARRGQLGDRYIEPVLSFADYAIVVEAGNEDGKFSDYCSANGIPLDIVAAMTDVAPVLAVAFEQ